MITTRTLFFVFAVSSIGFSAWASDSVSNKKPVDSSATTAAGKTSTVQSAAPASAPAQLSLTLKELAKYNGKNGNPAYVAVDGIIYDVTDVKAWKNGSHKGQHEAGIDLTEQINKRSPHGPRVLKKRPVVGKIVAEPVKK
jgi:predicted heme/steroid binding protein